MFGNYLELLNCRSFQSIVQHLFIFEFYNQYHLLNLKIKNSSKATNMEYELKIES